MMSTDQRPAVWIGHINMYSNQVKQSCEFMLAIGMRKVFSNDHVAVLEMRGGTHLVITDDAEFDGLSSRFDLMVDDIDASHQSFTALGLNPSDIERGNIHDEFVVTEPGGMSIKFNSSHVGDLPV